MTDIENTILTYLHRDDKEDYRSIESTRSILEAVQNVLTPSVEIEISLATLKESGYVKCKSCVVVENDIYRSELEWEGTSTQPPMELSKSK